MLKNISLIQKLLLLIVTYIALAGTNYNLMAQENVFAERAIDWTYKLKGYSPGFISITESKFDLAIIDYSFFGGADSEINKSVIDSLRFKGACKRKIILSYINIGTAEKERFYYEKLPGDLLVYPPSPGSTEKLNIKFWEDRWQKFIFGNREEGENKSYIDRIIDAGFDGVCLDLVNFDEFSGPNLITGAVKRETAVKEMVDFVVKIADYARDTRGKTNFVIAVQNGTQIVDPIYYSYAKEPASEAKKQMQRFIDTINIVVADKVFFNGDKENDNDLNMQEDTIKRLDLFTESGKKVFVVDYLHDNKKIDTFYKLAREHSYFPYATDRNLDIIRINDNYEPVCNDTLTLAVQRRRSKPVSNKPSPIQKNTSAPIPKGRKFIVQCDRKLTSRSIDIDVLPIRVGDSVNCTLIVDKELITPESGPVTISTILKTGNKVAININPTGGTISSDGKMEFTITGIALGIDWIAWTISTDNENLKPDDDVYKTDKNLWEMFVEVKE